MKVAIWSSYNYGNFGDDLMAIVFAKEVKRYGDTPMVYRLDGRVAKTHGVAATDSLHELMDDCDAVLIGGGALFTRESWQRVLLRKVTREFENDFKQLYKAVIAKNCPVYPLSIGGDGGGTSKGIPKWHAKLFSSPLCAKGTVRLPDCLAIAEDLNIAAEYIPDVVFCADRSFDAKSSAFNDGRLHIGLNLRATDNALIDAVANLAKASPGRYCFHYIKTHLDGYGLDYEYLPSEDTDSIKRHEYKDLDETIGFFAELDLLVTIKLHIGITSLSKGTPIISYKGKDKTKSFLKSIGADTVIWQEEDGLRLRQFLESHGRESLKQLFDWNKIEQIKNQAQSHLEFVRSEILHK